MLTEQIQTIGLETYYVVYNYNYHKNVIIMYIVVHFKQISHCYSTTMFFLLQKAIRIL